MKPTVRQFLAPARGFLTGVLAVALVVTLLLAVLGVIDVSTAAGVVCGMAVALLVVLGGAMAGSRRIRLR